MTADQFVRQIRAVQFDHFEGRISYPERERRLERLWDRVYEAGLVREVEAAIASQHQPPSGEKVSA